MPSVEQLRLVVTADDYDAALHFYRDVLGLQPRPAVNSPGGRVTILEAGAATLELIDPAQAAATDDAEVGHRVAGPIRVAFQVDDSAPPRVRWPTPGPRSSPRRRGRRGTP